MGVIKRRTQNKSNEKSNKKRNKKSNLFEINFIKDKTGKKVDYNLNKIKNMPYVFAPNVTQMRKAAKKVGLIYNEGRVVSENGKLNKKEYQLFKEALLKEMGLEGENLTARGIMFKNKLKALYPKEYEELIKNGKTDLEPLFLKYLKEETLYEDSLKSIYPTAKAAVEESNFESFRENHSEKFWNAKNNLRRAMVKRDYPEEYSEFERVYKEKGFTPKRILEEFRKFKLRLDKRNKRKKEAIK